MPIAQIIVYGDAARCAEQNGAAITEAVTEILTTGLLAKRSLVQVVLTAALAPPQGCEVLCQIFHRASEARTADLRAQVAEMLRDSLEEHFSASVRVRLMAIDPVAIAAADSEEAGA